MSGSRHLSPSQLGTLSGCGRQWRFKYVQGIPEPPNVDTSIGVAFHDAIERFHKARHSEGLGDDEAAEVAKVTLGLTWFRQHTQEDFNWKKHTPESARSLLDRLFDAFVRELASLARPVSVEESFDVPIPGIPGWTLTGRIDAVTSDGWLIDYKTSGQSYQQDKVDRNVQASAYLWAWQQKWGEVLEGVAFHVAYKPHPSTKAVKPLRTEVLKTRRSPEQLDWFADLLRETVRQIEAEVFPPNPEHFRCNDCPAPWRNLCMPWRTQDEPAEGVPF